MKVAIYALMLFLVVTGCSKSDDNAITPDRGRRMAGTYEVTSLAVQYGSEPKETIPFPLIFEGKQLLTINISVERKAEDKVNLKLNMDVDEAFLGQDLGVEDTQFEQLMEIRNNGSNYDLYDNGKKVATFNNDVFVVDSEEKDPDGIVIKTQITAKKKP